MYNRLLNLPKKPRTSLFLWGPRQTGKTTLLKQTYPNAHRIDLLKSDVLIKYLRGPHEFREEVEALPKSKIVVIDEIQKAPVLLNEIHYLIQEQNRIFILCGSSARKVKSSHANLLGGRAVRYELFGLVFKELAGKFNLEHFINAGSIPSHYDSSEYEHAIGSYVDDYLREEIIQEGIVRNLPAFSDFLRVAAIGDTELVNLANIARESGVSVSTVRDHYSVLVDTLLGFFLPAFTLRPKRRVVHAPKFYFFDIGIVNHLARRGYIQKGSELFGKAFESWLFHELTAYCRYNKKYCDISYWRLSSGIEVDFILGKAEVAIEVKGKKKINSNDVKGLLQFKSEYPSVKHLIIVSLVKQARLTKEGVLILPFSEFIEKLWSGDWV